MSTRTGYARSGELSIAYQVVGSGDLDLIVAPGFVSHLDWAWEEPGLRRFLDRLASFSRLILFDKRGTGLSDPVPAVAILEERVDDLRSVLDAVGSRRAAVLGISEGGAMAMLFAAQHPERTHSLVLLAASPRLAAAPDFPQGADPEQMRQLLDGVVQRWGTGAGLGAWAPSRRDDPALRRWWAGLQRMGASPAMARQLFAIYPDTDVRAVLGSITVPTLVLQRTGDRLIRREVGRYLADHIPGARYLELDGPDHLFFVGDQDQLLAEIEEFLTGCRPGPGQADRVLSTVLFVDVASSTETLARLGDASWRSVRESFLEATRRQLRRFSGTEVDATGDGVLATFDGPARAIRCALAVHGAAGALGLQVRAGVHAGEVERLSGGRVAGMTVHIGARVMASARPGEVLVTGTVKDLVVGSELRFADRGEVTLRGVPGTWRLAAVLPEDPPARP